MAPTSAPHSGAVHMRAFSAFFSPVGAYRAGGARLRLANGRGRRIPLPPLPCKQRMDCNGQASWVMTRLGEADRARPYILGEVRARAC